MSADDLRAGAVAYRSTPAGPVFLVITSRRGSEWIFPKGHIEAGEEPPMAAVRELKEEAGVKGRLVAPLGSLIFNYEEHEIEVEYFLIEALDEGAPQEGRKLRWLSFEDARKLLTHEDTKMLLMRVAERLGR